jgi:ferrochelatase
MARIGVLLINIGTPDEPTPEAVGRYLREFLMDEYVLDMPFLKRWLLVNRIIVPRRKHSSAEHYQKIQFDEGSPLLVHTQRFAGGLRHELADDENEYVVEIGMRYGNPSLVSGLTKLKEASVDRIVAAPLYPQYTQSSFETGIVATKKQAKKLGLTDKLTFLKPFYIDEAFIDAYARVVDEHLKTNSPDYTLFSYHGVPVRHIKQIDKEDYCRVDDTCCKTIGTKNANCYRAQCHATSRAIAAAVGLQGNKYTTCFQSQFGKDEWIGTAFEDVKLWKRLEFAGA